MDTAPQPVTQCTTLELIDVCGRATPVDAVLCYDPGDPYAVTAIFKTEPVTVEWTFGRELLHRGRHTPTGDGDVRVWPRLNDHGDAVVVIELSSPDGEALVQAPSDDVNSFVTQMSRTVRPGSESAHLDIDATIAAIFGAASS